MINVFSVNNYKINFNFYNEYLHQGCALAKSIGW